MTDPSVENYPDISQSFGIAAILIAGMILLSPVLLLEGFLGKELSMLIYYILAMGVPFWIVYSTRRNRTDISSFNVLVENKRIIPFVIVGTIALHLGIISPIVQLIPMSESFQKFLLDFGKQTGICTFINMVVAAPILEELIFRGIILDGLLKRYSPIKSILVSSFLFGLVHLNPWQFVTAFLLGIFSGWIYERTRSLTPSILIHATANFIGFSLRFYIDMDSAKDKTLLEAYGGLFNLILSVAGAIIIVSGCIYFLTKEFNKTKVEMATENIPLL